MSLREQLQQVRAQYGRLTPQHVVDAARPAGSALHDRFEWDDSIAGEAYRRQQAAALIRSVRIEYVRPSGEPATVRAYHSIPAAEGNGSRAYEEVEEIAEDPFARELLLRQMRRDWQTFKSRYAHLVEYVELVVGEAGGLVAEK